MSITTPVTLLEYGEAANCAAITQQGNMTSAAAAFGDISVRYDGVCYADIQIKDGDKNVSVSIHRTALPQVIEALQDALVRAEATIAARNL